MPRGADNAKYKHGHRRVAEKPTPTWNSWRAMIARCYNANASDYHRYGGRGITVCDRWRASFTDFLSDVGERPSGMSLDRVDGNGNYDPGNVRWATPHQQSRNRRANTLLTMDGRTQCLTDWAAETGIPRDTISYRLRKGWSVEEALTRPLMSRAERGVLGLRARGLLPEVPHAVGSAEKAASAKGRATRRARREAELGLLPLF